MEEFKLNKIELTEDPEPGMKIFVCWFTYNGRAGYLNVSVSADFLLDSAVSLEAVCEQHCKDWARENFDKKIGVECS